MTNRYGGNKEKLQQRKKYLYSYLDQVINSAQEPTDILIKWQLADQLDQLLTLPVQHELVFLGPLSAQVIAANLHKRGDAAEHQSAEDEIKSWKNAAQEIHRHNFDAQWHYFQVNQNHQFTKVGEFAKLLQ